MSEDGVYSLVYLPSFLGDVEMKWFVPDQILEVELARCIIGVFLGVVQAVQIWFI